MRISARKWDTFVEIGNANTLRQHRNRSIRQKKIESIFVVHELNVKTERARNSSSESDKRITRESHKCLTERSNPQDKEAAPKGSSKVEQNDNSTSSGNAANPRVNSNEGSGASPATPLSDTDLTRCSAWNCGCGSCLQLYLQFSVMPCNSA